MRTTRLGAWLVAGTTVLAALTGCGDGGDGDTAKPAVTPTPSLHEPQAHASHGSEAPADPANACPVAGCRITITDAKKSGSEITLSFDATFTPDVSRNHFHVYWDTYTAQQVSDDAQPRFGVTQGVWVPTQDNPYTTADDVSTAKRGTSHTLCVTAGDRRHDVIDPSLVSCRDVSALL